MGQAGWAPHQQEHRRQILVSSTMMLPGGLASGPVHDSATLGHRTVDSEEIFLAHFLIADFPTHTQQKLCVVSVALELSVARDAVAHRHAGWAAS